MTLYISKSNNSFILLMALLLSVFFGISSNTFHFYTSPSSKATPKAGTVYTTMVPAVAHVRDSSDIVRTLRGAGASASDLSTIVNDPILKALRELRDRRPDSLEEQHPEVRDLHDLSREVHDYSSDLMRSLDAPAQRIIDDVLIPTLCVTALAVDILAPPLAPLTSPMLAVAAPRLMPVIGRALTALGGAELYKRITTFFNESSFSNERDIKPSDRDLPREFTSDVFQKRVTWKCKTGTKQTYEVIQRGDIDWGRVRTNPVGGTKYVGKTNLEAAKAGFAPELSDGTLVQLHHLGQKSPGPLIEVSKTSHTFQLHGQFGTNLQNPKLPVDRETFKLDRRKYWIDRALEIEK